jgi:hypothetical protein
MDPIPPETSSLAVAVSVFQNTFLRLRQAINGTNSYIPCVMEVRAEQPLGINRSKTIPRDLHQVSPPSAE